MKRYIKEELEIIVKESNSFSQVLTKMGKPIHGGSVSHLKKRMIDFRIDYSHFLGRGWASGIKKITPSPIARSKEDFTNHFLKANGPFIITSTLKNKLLKFGVLENKCQLCGNEGLWQGKKLILQLDHKNGERSDNRLENLRILCPNCHSQTDTYCGKNNGE